MKAHILKVIDALGITIIFFVLFGAIFGLYNVWFGVNLIFISFILMILAFVKRKHGSYTFLSIFMKTTVSDYRPSMGLNRIANATIAMQDVKEFHNKQKVYDTSGIEKTIIWKHYVTVSLILLAIGVSLIIAQPYQRPFSIIETLDDSEKWSCTNSGCEYLFEYASEDVFIEYNKSKDVFEFLIRDNIGVGEYISHDYTYTKETKYIVINEMTLNNPGGFYDCEVYANLLVCRDDILLGDSYHNTLKAVLAEINSDLD